MRSKMLMHSSSPDTVTPIWVEELRVGPMVLLLLQKGTMGHDSRQSHL